MTKRVFKNFLEFYSLTRALSEHQKQMLFTSLPSSERAALDRACRSEGWEDLFVVNKIDRLIDEIKEVYGEDLIFIRIQVLSGKAKKLRRRFWDNVRSVFSPYSIRHTWRIFEGMRVVDFDNDFILLVPSKRRQNGKEIQGPKAS